MQEIAQDAAFQHDVYFHIRMVISMVTGLSLTRLLTGLAKFVQHPGRDRVYLVHLGWVLFLLLAVLHFWWFEFSLTRVERWSFAYYIFVVSYGALHFFLAVLLFPDQMSEYSGYRDYFHARQGWFYGLLALFVVIDTADTALKGRVYFEELGPLYPWRQGALALLALAGTRLKAGRGHLALVGLALAIQAGWIGWRYWAL